MATSESGNLKLSCGEKKMAEQYKDPANRLGFCVLLKFVENRGYFPKKVGEVPPNIIDHIAIQLDVSSKLIRQYSLAGRSCKRHKKEIKEFLGFREPRVKDRKDIVSWLCKELSIENSQNDFFISAQVRFLDLKILAPSQRVLNEIAASSLFETENIFFKKIFKRIPKKVRSRIDSLIEGQTDLNLSDIKKDPGRVGLDSLIKESKKLQTLRELGLDQNLFQGYSKKIIIHLKRRVASESLHEIKRHPDHIKYSLFATFSHVRIQELVDDMVNLLIQVIHKIGARAEKRVDKELLKDFKKVRGKDSILFNVAEAALNNPDEMVKSVIYPVANEGVLEDLIREFKSSGPIYRYKVQNVMRASYIHHYRRMIPIILDSLEFHSNNESHRPVIEGIEIIKKYKDSQKILYPKSEDIPIDGVVRKEWMSFVFQGDGINRANYELALLDALRSRLRCKEIWIPGSLKFCNPDEDLPQDFKTNKVFYFDKLKADINPYTFVESLKSQMKTSLIQLNAHIPKSHDVKILTKKKGWISLSPLDPQEEPHNITDIKNEVATNWPMTSLLDILKEAELRIGFTKKFETVGVRESMNKEVLQRRLLLCLYGLGTNMGLKRVCTSTAHGNYQDLQYIKRKFINRENLRNAIAMIADEIFKARLANIWGEGTTSCASDGKKFGSWDQNLMTEWHIRYHGRGVMIYWHVEKKSTCIFSQLKSCSSSEVASMIEGVLNHNTTMEIDKNFVDSHGQSEVGFAFSHLLGFKLMPRLKAIHTQKLYLPNKGELGLFPHLSPVLTRTIKWDLIINQYEEMIKHASALKLGFSDAETILKRFTRNNQKHPTYLAFCELGKVLKTIFLCNYLQSRDLRREIHMGLNVVENWNSANGFLFFGKNSEISTNCIAEQEISILALHLLQISMVYVNTLMVQRVLADEDMLEAMTEDDHRALTPLFYGHVNPYGSFNLDMADRLTLQ